MSHPTNDLFLEHIKEQLEAYGYCVEDLHKKDNHIHIGNDKYTDQELKEIEQANIK